MTDIRKAQMVGKNSEAVLVQRPLSPHLGVYRWAPTMLTSILNRATGVALSVGALVLVWWLVAAASGPEAFATVQNFLGSPLGLLMLLGWTASLFYHLFAGLRHLAWDAGHGLDKPGLNAATWLVLALSGLATLLVWIAGYMAMGA
jgi:succinate dehydrogenase / fumarate reductase cytochrome b subunit